MTLDDIRLGRSDPSTISDSERKTERSLSENRAKKARVIGKKMRENVRELDVRGGVVADWSVAFHPAVGIITLASRKSKQVCLRYIPARSINAHASRCE